MSESGVGVACAVDFGGVLAFLRPDAGEQGRGAATSRFSDKVSAPRVFASVKRGAPGGYPRSEGFRRMSLAGVLLMPSLRGISAPWMKAKRSNGALSLSAGRV